jgi:siroheme synthase
MDPHTPAFAMFGIARADARRIEGTIATLADELATAGATGPCLVLIGKALGAARAAQPERR